MTRCSRGGVRASGTLWAASRAHGDRTYAPMDAGVGTNLSVLGFILAAIAFKASESSTAVKPVAPFSMITFTKWRMPITAALPNALTPISSTDS